MIYNNINTDECHFFAGFVNKEGYGIIVYEGITYTAHRTVFESERGPIDSKLVVDHLCRNRTCINIEHLEAVTNKENVLRGVGPTAVNARKTHCPKGHPYSGDNLSLTKGPKRNRHCRICGRANSRAWYHRQKVKTD